jgi:predicted O-methyltransferase YrrM
MSKSNPLHFIRTALGNPAACRLAWRAIRRHYAVQSLWELTHLIGDVMALRPTAILEIGTHRGGTLSCWSRIVPPGATLVSLDLPADTTDTNTTVPVVEKVLPPGKKCVFLREDSHFASTFGNVKAALAGKPLDFLFIDGDHSYTGSKMDFDMYSGLVRKGGLIAFHDVVPNPEVAEYGIARFWQELKATRRTREYIDPHPSGPTGMGIGVVEVE